MKMDRELDKILGEIRSEHRAMDAPASVETALRAEMKRRRGEAGGRGLNPVWRPALRLALAAVLMAAIAWSGTAWEMGRIRDSQDRQAQSAQIHPAQMPSIPSSTDIAGSVLPPSAVNANSDPHGPAMHVRLAAVNRPLPHAATESRTAANSLEEFVPLPVSEGLPPAVQLSVVRVKLRGSDLPQYGLQAPADAVAENLLAEFVVGEDGLPRAIRIVH